MALDCFVTSAVKEMLAARAISILPKGERPEVVSPLWVVPKGTEGKFRLDINMRYANAVLQNKVVPPAALPQLTPISPNFSSFMP